MDFTSNVLSLFGKDMATPKPTEPQIDAMVGTSPEDSYGAAGGLSIGEGLRSMFQPKEGQAPQSTQSKFNVDKEVDSIMNNLIFTESNGIHREADGTLRVSAKGAMGITQLMPQTAGDPGYGIKPLQNHTPEEYVRFGRDYLSTMIRVFDNVEQGVAAYNAGPGAVHRAISKAGRTGRDWKEFLPKETQDYIKNVAKR